MTNQSIYLLVLILVLSLGLSYYQYFYLVKKRNDHNYILFFLRFLTYLTIGVLLLNPKFETSTTTIQKRSLVLLVDNSSSIKRIADTAQVKRFLNTISNDKLLNEQFDIKRYRFGKEFAELDTLDFSDEQTKIYEALQGVEQVFDLAEDVIVFISDGNQSVGLDYSRFGMQKKTSIFPVVVGDTVPKFDTKIDLVNANNFSFLENIFPVEVFVSYTGKKAVQTQLQLFHNHQLISSKEIFFNAEKNSQEIQFQVEANQIGLQLYEVLLQPLDEEQFKDNNKYQFGVEVIDEGAKILIATSILHPDVGMWKRSIETNKQRKVEVKLLGKDEIDIDLYQSILFYQPNSSFQNLVKRVSEKGIGSLTITGTNTDYSFLNTTQEVFQKEIVSSTEDYYSSFNPNFTNFQFDDIGFLKFPPLEDQFGQVRFKDAHQVLLFQKVQGITTENPMLFSYTDNSTKHIVLFGENSWRWRSQSYADQKNFKDFDAFVSGLIQYISSSDYNQRMIVEADNFYNEAENLQIKAKFYDANYNPVTDADLSIIIKDSKTDQTQEFPMLIQNGKFVFNTAGLTPGNYTYQIVEQKSQTKKEGQFKVVSYSVESQFINPNISNLRQLSKSNEMFFLDQVEQLQNTLYNSQEFKPIQSTFKNNQSLINSFYLLLFLALTLLSEWFLRKYQGLI